MIKTYLLEPIALDFSSQILRHSANKTVTYKTVNGEDIHLCYFYPDCVTDTPRPALVLVHGGGWASRKIFPDQSGLWQGDYLGYLARYYADLGFICVCIDYRLSREEGQCANYQLIDCYDDCVDAMDYLLDHAEENHIDTNEIRILGESAGGHLAGMLACLYRRENFGFRTAFLYNGVLDLAACPVWNKRVPATTEHPVLKDLSLPQRAAYLSPVHMAHAQMCPVVLIHGKCDTTVGLFHSENMYNRLQQIGVPCDLHILEETNHAFLLAEYTKNHLANQLGVSILNSYILS